MTRPIHVLFVCTANICRSPYMELVARQLSGDALTVSSAGTHGEHDQAIDDEMAAVLTKRGVASEAFRSRRVTAELIDDADLVLTAEVAHRRFILEERPTAYRKVFTLGQFAEVVSAADGLSGRSLLEAIARRRPSATPDLDVTDPYRRGPEAAAAAGRRIESLLRVVVPALTGSERISA